MKKVNLPVRVEEWVNEGEGSGMKRGGERATEKEKFCLSLFVYERGKLRVTA